MPNSPSADPLLEDALARALHDIAGPLTVISGNVQMLQEDARLEGLAPDIRAQLREMSEASDRLAEEVRRLARLKENPEQLGAGGDGL